MFIVTLTVRQVHLLFMADKSSSGFEEQLAAITKVCVCVCVHNILTFPCRLALCSLTVYNCAAYNVVEVFVERV